MCMVSAIGQEYYDDYYHRYPPGYPWTYPPQPIRYPNPPSTPTKGGEHTHPEFDELRKEVEELKNLLKRAKKFDQATGQPDCEVDEKVDFIKRLADFVDVDLEDVFGNMKPKKKKK